LTDQSTRRKTPPRYSCIRDTKLLLSAWTKSQSGGCQQIPGEDDVGRSQRPGSPARLWDRDRVRPAAMEKEHEEGKSKYQYRWRRMKLPSKLPISCGCPRKPFLATRALRCYCGVASVILPTSGVRHCWV
jgi:hypothetical protein